MEANIQTFYNKDFNLRIVYDDNGQAWAVAKDIAENLGYERFDSNLIKHVPEIWKGTKRIRTPGGEQEMLCLTENGVYFFLGIRCGLRAKSSPPSESTGCTLPLLRLRIFSAILTLS